ncbi:MAG TPA: hypothetical protein VFK07_01835 [Candidatus Paceibacterota bacterium]|nr:hypothetical protein [Candidatus Paceibacterota bacterium]
MDINELKKMLKSSTAVLILDNGEPSFVVVGYEAYKSLLGNQQANGLAPAPRIPDLTPSNGQSRSIPSEEVELLERINKDILALKAQIEEEESKVGID